MKNTDGVEAIISLFESYKKMIAHHGPMGQMLPCCGNHELLSTACDELKILKERVENITARPTDQRELKKGMFDNREIELHSLVVEGFGMIAANQEREHRGEAMAYTESEFIQLTKDIQKLKSHPSPTAGLCAGCGREGQQEGNSTCQACSRWQGHRADWHTNIK